MPVIGITIGDPFGIGPEIVEKGVLHYIKKSGSRSKLLIFGSKKYIKSVNFPVLKYIDEVKNFEGNAIFENFPEENGEIGKATASGGRLSFLYLEKALQFAKEGMIDALITAPISKIAWEMAGIKYKGHTEFLRDFFGVKRVIMSFFSKDLKVALFTHHIPLKDLFGKIKEEDLEIFIRFLFEELKRFNFDLEVLVAGINPHAGEEGTMGDEEKKIVEPVIEKLKRDGFRISGPYPSDSLFYSVKERNNVIIFCFYHDQGLIPFKLMHFKDGVHLTLGLPILRLSPVHGTAFDIAGKGIADPSSMVQCLYWAEKMILSSKSEI